MRRHMSEIRNGGNIGPYLPSQLAQFLMGAFKELVEQTKFMHHIERGWMNRVASKIPKKIAMLLKNHDLHAHARQEEGQHHPGGSAADDAATRVDLSVHANPIMANSASLISFVYRYRK